ncbi:beta-glucuronidase [Agrilus planipennis]|uniref:Beta-glucuronidase n=1 Tax=Agrilus planipennis TaxID=224129 RepID=A0A1W4WJ63_AGRPL|nr:beta-glucuronidase [Agrilus planipennis]
MRCFKFLTCTLLIILYKNNAVSGKGILYPKQSETRETMSLDGLWNFLVSPITDPLVGFRETWYRDDLVNINSDTQLMPVPSSYNDITEDGHLRDHVGLVWYDRTFFVPSSWGIDKRVWLRFSSVSYAAQVWINGDLVMNHEIGHLPFQKEVTSLLNYGGVNRVTVACDNTLLQDTVPQGIVSEADTDRGKKLVQSYTFDFFNYGGIHRPVTLYTTPIDYLDDITVHTDIEGGTGIIKCDLTFVTEVQNSTTCVLKLLDNEGYEVAYGVCNDSNYSTSVELTVPGARLWWPYLMNPRPGYLYTLQVELKSAEGDTLDVYRLPVGIRTLKWTNSSFFINNRPVYLHGFGRHEDSDIRGKGLDLPLVMKDYNLIKWIGANAYRTSHYPYADEIMDLADQMGIMIIDECPSVDTDAFSFLLLEKHKDSLTELIRRDKNRPSVIAWSIANEPRTQTQAADEYFGAVARHVRNLDRSRPITMSIARWVEEDRAGKHVDIISFNRYNAWYQNTGKLDMITNKVIAEARSWHAKYNKPVLMSEYGADTQEGLHLQPGYVWSEEFQVELMSRHFKAFDALRKEGWFIGEFIWNFADFKTAQVYTRVGGNKKGIFTRNRQPKAAAHHLRKRYWALSQELHNGTIPNDLHSYVAPTANKIIHNEL